MQITNINDFEILSPPHHIIKEQRMSLGYSEEQIADLCKINLKQYLQYESGEKSIESASFQIGIKICHHLIIDPERFFYFGES